MGSGLDGYAQRLLGGEAPPEGRGSGAQPPLLDHLAALLIDEAQVGVLVAEIQSGCKPWLFAATITHGPILLPYWAFRARRAFADPLGYCVRGVGLLIPSSEDLPYSIA